MYMKSNYEELELEIIFFDAEDVILTSNTGETEEEYVGPAIPIG